jgi:predicted double-glycine peptidase
MPRKNIIKTTVPTPSNTKKSTRKIEAESKTKAEYKKLTEAQKMDYELEQLEKTEANFKNVAKSKGYSYKSLTKAMNKQLDKYEPSISILENTKYKGQDILSIRINENKYLKDNQKFRVKDIQKISDKFSKHLNEAGINGNIMTSLKYGNLNWKSGYMRNVGENVKMYDPNELYNLETPYVEPSSIPSFNIYVALGKKKAEGGYDDEYNDCLYNCLKYYVFNIEEYFKSPAEFKAFLKLKRRDKVPLHCIDIIEKKLKNYQINIRGDFVRTSSVNNCKQINILLLNEHYSVEKVNRRLLPALLIKYEEKTIVMCDRLTLEVYDGNKKWVLTKEERQNMLYSPKSPYILVDRIRRNKNDPVITIEEEYEQYIKIADTLKKESKGMINLYKTNSYHDTALNLFDRLSKFINPERILQDEALWNKLSTFGAIINCTPHEGKLYKYDCKSLYPYLMTVSTNKFPVKRGEFKIIDNFSQYVEFGIYRCIIEKSEDENLNKLFKFNYHNYYTHVDITNAQKLGFNIELIKDGSPNFLFYSRDKVMTMSELFDNYIKVLFPIKDNDKLDDYIRTASKKILNILWGSLGEVDKIKYYITKNKFSMEDDEEILELYPSNTSDDDTKAHVMKTTKINAHYRTDFARLTPYIIAFGRRHMTNIMYPYKDNIYRVQTDGFLCDIPIHYNKDVKLGELKYEGFTEHGQIINCINKVEVHY